MREPVRPADLSALVELDSVQLSDDGLLVAAVVTRLHQEANRIQQTLITGTVDGGPLRERPSAKNEVLPRWGPAGREGSGRYLASVRSDSDASRLVLRLVDADGALLEESERELARWSDPVTELSWSPDGRWLLAVVREQRDRARVEMPEEARPPLHLTRLRYRYDGIGYTFDRPRQAYLVPVMGGPPRKLSHGWYDDSDFAWHPDGSVVAFVSQRHARQDRTLLNDVFLQSVDDTEPRQITRTEYQYQQPRFSPDGALIAVVVLDVGRFPSTNDLAVIDAASGDVIWRSEELDRDCERVPTDGQGPVWIDDRMLLALVEDQGMVHAVSATVDEAGELTRVVDGERWITSLAAARGGTLAFVTASPTDPPALAVRVHDGDEQVIYAPNGSYRDSHDLRRPDHVTIETTPGIDVDTWLMLPDTLRWQAPHPLLVSMQGGGTQYGYDWWHESQALCGAGFAVLYMNARGCGGYGKDWYRAVCGPGASTPAQGWGQDDISDMLAVVETRLQQTERLDPTRVGVLGGSYGALCVTWMLARSDRFRAGWAERGPYNLYSLAGTNDESPWFFTSYLGRNQVEEPQAYWSSSPLRLVADIDAPLMIVHSENDLRCPIQQAEELFMAMKILDRDVEFIRFPGEGHSLTRTGSPAHRLQRLELMVEWFARWLKPKSTDETEPREVEAVGISE